MKDFQASISKTSERAETWLAVFGSKTIPLKSPIPYKANIPEKGSVYVYDLDLSLLTQEQRQRLVIHIAKRFDYEESFVDKELDSMGCPILAEDVTIIIHNPQKWI